MTSRLQTKYLKEIVPKIKKELGYRSPMQVARLEKISINRSIKNVSKNPKLLETSLEEFFKITGQKAVISKAKKPISNFGIRKDMPIGTRITLRGGRMYEFLDRLITLALPRVRDFRGVSKKSFDGRGNYTLGIKNQAIFPEINIENVTTQMGMDIAFVTSAKNDEVAHLLLKELGLPF